MAPCLDLGPSQGMEVEDLRLLREMFPDVESEELRSIWRDTQGDIAQTVRRAWKRNTSRALTSLVVASNESKKREDHLADGIPMFAARLEDEPAVEIPMLAAKLQNEEPVWWLACGCFGERPGELGPGCT